MPDLIWDGKYGEDGRKTAPLKVALPFQTVETINESGQDRQRSLFTPSPGATPDWRNRLVWGDKKYVLPALLEEFAGSVDLIYIDPPFFTGDNFTFRIYLEGDEFVKEPSVLEQKAYRDTWGSGLDGYLHWFYDTVVLLRDLISETGSIIVHLDWHVGHYAKIVLDQVFGIDNFRNEIAWCYGGGGAPSNYYHRKHDTLFWYSKSNQWKFNIQRRPYTEGTKQRGLTAVKGPDYELHEEGAALDDWWPDCQKILSPTAYENLKFPTQKPESLVTRIVVGHTDEDDLVLDCFVGSGTTAAVAEKLGRRWIAADIGRFAVHTSRKRLLSIPELKPFVVQNLGKYERQLWQAAEFGESAAARTAAYRSFILQLYNAQEVQGYSWLHGLKKGHMVHVGTVDAPVTVGDVKQIAMEFRKSVGKGKDSPSSASVDVLGWDFAFEVNELSRQDAAKAGIDMRFVRIPREVLDKRAVAQGDVAFYELAALSVDIRRAQRRVTLTINDFVIPLDDVPEDVQRAVTKWPQWIDYWAVDWDNRNDTFHNEWQSYRSRKEPNLDLSTTHDYDKPGEYTVVVKVIDILGNDTTKTLSLKIPASGRSRAS